MEETFLINILSSNLPVAKSVLDAKKIYYFVKGENSINWTGFGYNPAFPVQIGISLRDKEKVKKLLEGL